MASNCIILGRSGTGKSTSIKNLNPKETVIFNVLKKRLPFKGSNSSYNVESKNLFVIDEYTQLIQYLESINTKATYVKNIIIDDMIYIMRKEYFRRAKEAGYNKYTELAQHFQQIIQTCENLRDDINVFFILHSEDITSDNNITGYKVSTIGKLLDNQYNPIEVVPIVLYSDVKYDDKGNASYGFYTHRTKIGTVEIPAKCFAENTEIIMADNSLKKVQDIKVGDFVLGTNGKPCKVKSIFNGTSDLYEISQKYGCTYTVNQEHLVVTNKGLIEAKNISNNDRLYHTRIPVEYYNEISNPYFVGLWLGDGASEATSVTSMDSEIIEYLKELAEAENLNCTIRDTKSKAFEIDLGGIFPYVKEIIKYDLDGNYIESYTSIKDAAEKNNLLQSNITHCAQGKYKSCGGFKWSYGKTIYGNKLRELLKSYDLINNKHIPEEFLYTTLSNRNELLAGLIDSDGTKSDNRYIISTQYKDMADRICLMAKSCGYISFISHFANEKYNKTYYSVTIAGDVSGIPVKLKRKKVDKKSSENNYITSKFVGNGKYFGFELEGKCKTMYLKDYTVVHNCPEGMFEEDFIPNDLALVVKAMNDYYN